MLQTGRTLESFQCCDQSVTCISSGLEGVRKIILVAAYTSPIYVCDAMSGLLLRMLEGHSKTVFCMQVGLVLGQVFNLNQYCSQTFNLWPHYYNH